MPNSPYATHLSGSRRRRRCSAGPVSVWHARDSTCGWIAKRGGHGIASPFCSIAPHTRCVLHRKVVHQDPTSAEPNESFAASKQVNCVASSHTRPLKCRGPQGAMVTRAPPARRRAPQRQRRVCGALLSNPFFLSLPLLYGLETTASGRGCHREPADALPHPPLPPQRGRGGAGATCCGAPRRARSVLRHQRCSATKGAGCPTQARIQQV